MVNESIHFKPQWFILNPNDPFDTRKIEALLKSDQALFLPNDILNMIVVSYIEARLYSKNFNHKSPVRRIETDSSRISNVLIRRE